VLERIAVHSCPIVICGDFNTHVDQTDDVHAVRFGQLLQSFGLVQHVNEPTHSAGHTLDLVITRTDTEVTDLHVGDMISDHALVFFYTRLKKPRSDTQLIASRAWRRLSHDAFASDLSESRLCGDTTELADMSADDLGTYIDES